MCLVYALAMATLVTMAAGHARAQDQEPDSIEMSLARALEARVTVWRSPGGRVVYVSHCRAVPRGCRARVAAFARWIAQVSRERELDPFVLAAMAVRESGLDPFARGPAGELGIIQLHPRGIGGRVRFIRSEGYRRMCRRQAGACQQEVLETGADHLAQAIAQCGSLEAGLGAYNSGACHETAYTRRVLRERSRLLELAKASTRPATPGDVD